MLPNIAAEEFSACLDAVVVEFLAAADWNEPPVDALELTRRAGMLVAIDTRLAGRARTVRLHRGRESVQSSILLRPEPRAERRQWAIAHEIGEQLAVRVFALLGVSPVEADPAARERVANLLAARLLLPGIWFEDDARRCHWDLFELKARYPTASHELIARRMLDFATPIIVSVFDQAQLTWRKSNLPGRAPSLSPVEQACWTRARQTGTEFDASQDELRVQAWPIHEPDWQREILRTECQEL